jgi:two-component system, NarL family, nitrate/nitrite response regulator NarL
MISLLVIDDHPLVASGIAAMLRGEDIEVKDTAKTGMEALGLISSNQYHIILLDISLPDMDGLVLCSEIRKADKTAKILGLTSVNETGIITQLLQRGGNGYLLKNMERNELLEAVYKVLGGKIYLSKEANDKILEQYRNIDLATQSIPTITRREKEILGLLNEGLNGPQIASKLFLSPYTVETHRKNLMQKFNMSSTQLLLKTARELQLIT